MTSDEFIKVVKAVLSSELQENYISYLKDSNVEIAMKLALSKTNSRKPSTTFSIEDLISDEKAPIWFDTIVSGTCHYSLNIQASEWMHNGIDVSIGDIVLENKMTDYHTVADRFKEEFLESLDAIKSQMYISKQVTHVTNAIPSSRGGSSSTSSRYCTYYKATIY